MIRPLILLGIMLSIPGCGLDILEGKKSDFQVEQERRAAFAMPVAAPDIAPDVVAETPPVPDIAPEPPAAEPEPSAPVVVPVAVCAPRWRVLDCDADGGEVWL